MKIFLLLFSAYVLLSGFELHGQAHKNGFKILFDGTNLDEWVGNKVDYVVENGILALHPENKGGGNLYTKKEYSDFEFHFEFKLTPGANNGVGIRALLMVMPRTLVWKFRSSTMMPKSIRIFVNTNTTVRCMA